MVVICRSYGAEEIFWADIYKHFVPTKLVERVPVVLKSWTPSTVRL